MSVFSITFLIQNHAERSTFWEPSGISLKFLWEFSLAVNLEHEPHNHEGVLWIYGDSISKRFEGFLRNGPYSKICNKLFKKCKSTYTWIYNLEDEWLALNMIDGKDYNHDKVMREINKVK